MSAVSLAGVILKGRYCIIEKIGRGGTGSLYLARDMELGVFWAVKALPLESRREACFFRQLEHPGLPRMVDYAEEGDFCYLVMEYIRGKSLGELLREGRVFEPQEVIRIGLAAAEILGYFHKQKPPVYYGDLKPDNLMLGPEEKVYLVDLGSAVRGYESQGRAREGTPGYAAPEQFQGKIGKTSDVYALGKTMRVLLGKKLKWCLIHRPGFVWCLMKCCRNSERMRYPDMESLGRALERLGRTQKRSYLVPGILALAVSMVFYLCAGRQGREIPLKEALTGLTDAYYDSAFLKGDGKEREKTCREIDEGLQKLLMEYRDADEQKELLMLLALNGELMGEAERAALYYEQLLLYYPGEEQGYAAYGLFLCRQGQEEASRLLWDKYCEEKRNGVIKNDVVKNEEMKNEAVKNEGMKNKGIENEGMKNKGIENEGMKNEGIKNETMKNGVIKNEGMKNDGGENLRIWKEKVEGTAASP